MQTTKFQTGISNASKCLNKDAYRVGRNNDMDSVRLHRNMKRKNQFKILDGLSEREDVTRLIWIHLDF